MTTVQFSFILDHDTHNVQVLVRLHILHATRSCLNRFVKERKMSLGIHDSFAIFAVVLNRCCSPISVRAGPA